MAVEATTRSAIAFRMREDLKDWSAPTRIESVHAGLAWEWRLASARLQGFGATPASGAQQRFLSWYRDQLDQVVGQLMINPLQAEDVMRSIPIMIDRGVD